MSAVGEAIDVPGASSAKGQPIEAKWFIIAGAVLVVAWLALVPLGFLVWQSFMTTGTPSAPPVFTLKHYAQAYNSPETPRLFANSLIYASGAATMALILGIVLAWLNERTNTPFKALFFASSVVPLIVPGILFTVSWIMIASPKIGLINLVLQGLTGTDYVFVDVYSMTGMIVVDGLHYAPIAFLMMTAALRSMDPSLEESALMSGASTLSVAWHVTLKLTWPAILASFLILFIRAIESFEVPALLGLPVGIHVFTSSIYEAIHSYPSNIGLGAAYAVTLLLITSVGIWAQARLSAQGAKYSTVTGKGFRPRVQDLGPWRWVAAAFFFIYLLLVVLLPFLILVWSSLQKFYSVPSWKALSTISLDAYVTVINYPNVGTAVWNSVLLSLGSATIIMLLTSVLCWIVVRTKLPGRWLIDNVASMPMVFPGLVLGLAVMICYLTFDIGIYGTIWIMVLAYVTRFMPYGMRYTTTSMMQIHRELEESAAMGGASWATTFWRIILPLMKPGLIAGWIYIVIVSFRELSSSILLYSPGSEVVSIIVWELWQNGQYVELSALGVLMILALFVFVLIAQLASRRFGVKEG